MTVSLSVQVIANGRTTSTTLRQVVRDIQKIQSYHGSTVRITVEAPNWSLFPGKKPLYQVVEQMLAEADATTSPHYRAPPHGLPYPERVRAAMAAFNNGSPEFRRAAEQRSAGMPARNRQEFLKQNPELISHLYLSGPLETEFRRLSFRSPRLPTI